MLKFLKKKKIGIASFFEGGFPTDPVHESTTFIALAIFMNANAFMKKGIVGLLCPQG
jgi:hypothetical protein